MYSQTATIIHTRKGDQWRHIIQTSFLLGFGRYHMVSGRRGQQTALPTRVCLVSLSHELTGMIGEGDTLTTAALQWALAGWHC